jgi:DNA mismatch repair protein MSH5
MAQIGSFVPCDECSISIVDHIFTQFARVETCAVPQSSFQLDLTQMGTIFRKSTPRSLVIIDEFGNGKRSVMIRGSLKPPASEVMLAIISCLPPVIAGTSPSSGIALLVAALRWFASKKTAVLCTSHFLEMFSQGFLIDGQNGINAIQMAVHVPDHQEDTATPLFRLEQGVASSSAGIICARMAGLDKKIVSRAKEVVARLKARKPIEPCLDVLREEAERNISSTVKQALGYFFTVPDWTNASDDEVETLIRKVEDLRKVLSD